LQEANRLVAETQKENMSLKEELKKLNKKMKDEEESKLKAYAQADKKEGSLRKSIESLLGKTSLPCLLLLSLRYFVIVMNCFL
jgi:hydroxymethylglutaryl-CoA reductase